MRLQILVALCASLAVGAGHAQDESSPSFEVASVRLSAASTQWSQRITTDRFDVTKHPMSELLWMAFRIEPFCCRDHLFAPEWANTLGVDIHATIPSGRPRQQIPEMLKSLLVQRFGLRFHIESRATEGYKLVVGKGGLRMKEVKALDELAKEFPADPSRNAGATRDRTDETVNGRVRTMQIPLGERTITERTMYDRTFTARGTQQINAARMTMPELASILARNTGRPVLNETNLTGIYSFTIELPPDAFVRPLRARASIGTAADGRPLDEPTGASAPGAVEQLGLRLERERVPVDIVIVDNLERIPSDN